MRGATAASEGDRCHDHRCDDNIRPRIPLRVPDQDHGAHTNGLRAGGRRRRPEACPGLRCRVARNARVESRQLALGDGDGERDLARAARRSLPRARRASDGEGRALSVVLERRDATLGGELSGGVVVRRLGRSDYTTTWRAMQDFTTARAANTSDEIWLTEHPPVYTLGLAGRREHLLRDNGIAVVKADRGGQVTYHGPGQLVV